MIDPASSSLPVPVSGRTISDDPLWTAARALEQNFLSEMLKAAGLDEARGTFGGGVGEDQFSSYIREAQAEAMVEAGGIGLAERLFHAISGRSDAG